MTTSAPIYRSIRIVKRIPAMTWLLLLGIIAPLAAQAPAVITGRVSNKATGLNLEGALVAIESINQSAYTGRSGEYTIEGVPEGSYSLAVSYTGLDSQTVPVEVRAGERVRRDVELTAVIYQLDKFTVTGEREGSAEAVTLQRIAPNLKNVMSADAFGNIADGNIGNFLQRLPGLSVVDDEGEIYRIMVRGTDPNLNSVTMDGTRIASASNRGPLDRSVEIDKIPADFIERIEVVKAMTPDLDADSIGGTVNLKTKSALDYKQRVFSYLAGTSYNVRRETFRPIGSFMYADILGKEKNLGVLFTASFNQTHKPRDSAGLAYEATADTDRPIWFSMRFEGEDQLTHERTGLGLSLDYKLNESHRLYFNTMYSHYGDTLARRRVLFNGVNDSRVKPGWTDTVTETLTHNSIRFIRRTGSRDRQNETAGFKAGGESSFLKGTLDYNISYSNSEGNDDRGEVNVDIRGVGFRFDRTRSIQYPEFFQIGGPDITNIENARLSALEKTDQMARDSIAGAEVNFKTRFDTKHPTSLKAGLRYRQQERELDDSITLYNNYLGTGGLTQFVDTSYNYQPLGGIYPRWSYIDRGLMVADLQQNPQNYVRDTLTSVRDSLTGDAEAEEKILAGYVMGDVKFGRLSVVGGLRMERTRVWGEGSEQLITPEEQARRDAWVGPVTDAELARRTEAEYGNRRSNSGGYRDLFPSVHLKYDISKNFLARLSYSTGIGRPGFGDILPRIEIDHTNMVVSANNIDLKPQYSDNFDGFLEYYFEPAGMISAGVFRKDISDFIYSDTGGIIGPDSPFAALYSGYELRSNFNGGYAKVRGWEVAYQQQFTNLPGIWKGLGVFANYTHTEAEGDYGQVGTLVTDAELENFTPRTYNAGISYIARGLTVRVKFSHRDATLDQYATNAGSRRYKTGLETVDLNLKYDWRPQMSFFVDVINLFDEPTSDRFFYIPSRPERSEQFTTAIKFGVSGRF